MTFQIPSILRYSIDYIITVFCLSHIFMYVIASTSYFSLYMKQVFQLYYYMYYILWLSPQNIWNLNQFFCILQTRSYAYSVISHDVLIESDH